MCFWRMSCEVGTEDKCASSTGYCALQTTLIIMVTAAVNDVVEILLMMQLLEHHLPLITYLYMHKHLQNRHGICCSVE